MTEKWRHDIIQEGKKRMKELLVPRPSSGTLTTRMFDFVDWFGERVLNLTEERFLKIDDGNTVSKEFHNDLVEGLKEKKDKQVLFWKRLAEKHANEIKRLGVAHGIQERKFRKLLEEYQNKYETLRGERVWTGKEWVSRTVFFKEHFKEVLE